MNVKDNLLSCLSEDGNTVDVAKMLEHFQLDFEGLSLSDCKFIVGDLKEIIKEMESSELVDCYSLWIEGQVKTWFFAMENDWSLQEVLDFAHKELEKVQSDNMSLAKKKIPKKVLEDLIKDREEWFRI